jgi:hypothetical protein
MKCLLQGLTEETATGETGERVMVDQSMQLPIGAAASANLARWLSKRRKAKDHEANVHDDSRP